ncbi:hypothetical protein UFOVP1451_13 [uncultured Caudovirales phage]|uniref:Uncharacterized protein n=1 Tax=uncultured Caudovirales phage TaxID=2100421 RepID=A0A6J5SGP8_9CAUD|nr:hypothetical protein UFOVP1451_13 [uncultured Caudovirales phage]
MPKYSKSFSLDRKVAWYLMASYLYYEEDFSLMSDGDYDDLCKELYEFYEILTHPHVVFLNQELLKCGSGFGLRYPQMTISAAEKLMFR